MNKSKKMKLPYMQPETTVIYMEPDTQLLNGSFQGGHDDAEDDQELNAKQGFFEDEDDLWAKGW